MRTVFVFHLRPVGEVLHRDEDLSSKAAAPTGTGSVIEVPLENHIVGDFARAAVEAGTGFKREQDLVNAFQTVLVRRGHELNRFKVYPKGSTMPLFTDIHDRTEGILYEAKADATRNSVRAGLGQLLDYRRYVEGRPCRLLLPAAPNADLLELLTEHDIAAVWRAGETSTFHIHQGGETRPF